MNMLEGRDGSTAEHMFTSIENQLRKNELSWDMVTSIGLDNTNANIGDHNSIKSRALERNPEIVISGCSCHILHNAASKAADAFAAVSDFSVEDHCVDLYYWFDKSSKGKSILKEYYDFCDQDYQEVINMSLHDGFVQSAVSTASLKSIPACDQILCLKMRKTSNF